MRPLHALFLCDGSPSVGGGHVMRSLTLAQALAERGWRSWFLADPFVANLLDTYDVLGCSRFAVQDQRPETLMAAAAGLRFDAIVVDHFEMGGRGERSLRESARLVVIVDDLPGRVRSADLLVDCNLGRTREEYFLWWSPNPEFLLGPPYAPVRPAFRSLREQALERRAVGSPVERVLVSLGLTDVGGITSRVVRLLRSALGQIALDVVIGDEAESLPYLRRVAELDSRIRLHKRVLDMASLMTSADVAIGAGGSSTWERCSLGLPTLTLVLAPNQAPGARKVAEAGAAVVVDVDHPAFEADLLGEFERLVNDHPARMEMGRNAADLCDGLGAGRTADRLTARLQSGARQ